MHPRCLNSRISESVPENVPLSCLHPGPESVRASDLGGTPPGPKVSCPNTPCGPPTPRGRPTLWGKKPRLGLQFEVFAHVEDHLAPTHSGTPCCIDGPLRCPTPGADWNFRNRNIFVTDSNLTWSRPTSRSSSKALVLARISNIFNDNRDVEQCFRSCQLLCAAPFITILLVLTLLLLVFSSVSHARF